MKAAGIPVRGAYHFGHVPESAVDQANHFTSTVGSVGAGEFYTLDIEVTTSQLIAAGNWSAKSQADVAAWSVAFCNQVMKNAGVGPNKLMIYTGAYFWNDNTGGSSALAQHPLWVAAYSASPPVTKGWGAWTMWQFTDKHSSPGVSGGVDYSRFRGTQSELESLVR